MGALVTFPAPAREKQLVTKATILIIQGVDQGARFEISADSAGIGRGAINEIRILDTEVSRQHAPLVRRRQP